MNETDQVMGEIVAGLEGVKYHNMLTLRLDENGDPAPPSWFTTNRSTPGPGHDTEAFALYASEVSQAIKEGAYEATRITRNED